MRMPRVRFTVRGLMVAVAVTALVLGAAAALMPRRSRMPRDAFEALVYIRQQGSGFPDFDDIEVRKIRPGEPVGSQFGGLFYVVYVKRDARGSVLERRRILLCEGGYCMQLKPEPDPPEPE